ncbi:MAG: hypothetical protein GXY06_04900 [Clostridiaceae bacterium]|nr:hypothetical protein [Clostridiaceae bacterium]
MDQSGSRKSQIERNRIFIVKTKKSVFREMVIILLSLVAWTYCLAVTWFFVDSIFAMNQAIPERIRDYFGMDAGTVRRFSALILLLFVLFFLLLLAWSVYNKRKFGSLRRRKYPQKTTEEELLALKMIDRSVFLELQNAKRISFNNNPIKRKR